jgi:hypothetical protein
LYPNKDKPRACLIHCLILSNLKRTNSNSPQTFPWTKKGKNITKLISMKPVLNLFQNWTKDTTKTENIDAKISIKDLQTADACVSSIQQYRPIYFYFYLFSYLIVFTFSHMCIHCFCHLELSSFYNIVYLCICIICIQIVQMEGLNFMLLRLKNTFFQILIL